ncbi:MAG: DNA replication/repair protein RecF [Spirochaetales bacterium]|nr:DNA replication/repair protein RecF [Spirochaetales bacterium]
MGFRFLKTYNFRNLKDAKIPLPARTIYLVGENGQGKSNFLEAIHLLCFGSSFRTKVDKLIITHEKKEMAIIGLLEKEQENVRINFKFSGKKQIEVNGKKIKDRKELLYNTPCILFCHEDIGFVKGSPDRKRWFMNQTIGLYDPLFIDDLRKYSHLLKMRNSALKEGKIDILSVIDIQLVPQALTIMEKRTKLMEEFQEPFSKVFSTISGFKEKVELEYIPSWKGVSTFDDGMKALEITKKRDLKFGISNSGPHRDNIGFKAEGRDFTKEASTGQLRLISLIMRVAQGNFYTGKVNKKPILLLDDVLLELDPMRRKKFISSLPEYEQAFFTFLPEENILNSRDDSVLVYNVTDGVIS